MTVKNLPLISTLNLCYVGNTFPSSCVYTCCRIYSELATLFFLISSSQSSQTRSVSLSPDPTRRCALQDSFLLLKGDPGNMTVAMRDYDRFICIGEITFSDLTLTQTRNKDSSEANKLATSHCRHRKADLGNSNSLGKYCSGHNSTEEGLFWPPLLSQYTRENKIQTLLKFKVPYRQSSNESAKAHIAKICLSFMLPERQPLPFV